MQNNPFLHLEYFIIFFFFIVFHFAGHLIVIANAIIVIYESENLWIQPFTSEIELSKNTVIRLRAKGSENAHENEHTSTKHVGTCIRDHVDRIDVGRCGLNGTAHREMRMTRWTMSVINSMKLAVCNFNFNNNSLHRKPNISIIILTRSVLCFGRSSLVDSLSLSSIYSASSRSFCVFPLCAYGFAASVIYLAFGILFNATLYSGGHEAHSNGTEHWKVMSNANSLFHLVRSVYRWVSDCIRLLSVYSLANWNSKKGLIESRSDVDEKWELKLVKSRAADEVAKKKRKTLFLFFNIFPFFCLCLSVCRDGRVSRVYWKYVYFNLSQNAIY